MTTTNVSQFSVDCQDLSVATTAVPSTVPTGARNPAGSTTTDASTSSTDTELSGGVKAGIAIAAAVGGVLLVALLIFFVVKNNRKKRRQMEVNRLLEADSHPAAPPYPAEMPQNEKKTPMELSAAVPAEIASLMMAPVEAPGDEHWPSPQEMPGDYAPSEIEGSFPHHKGDTKTVVSEDKTLVGSEGKRDSKVATDTQP